MEDGGSPSSYKEGLEKREKKGQRNRNREWATVQKHNMKQSVRHYLDCILKYHFLSLADKTISFTDFKNNVLFQKATKHPHFYFPHMILCFITLLTGRRGQHLTE